MEIMTARQGWSDDRIDGLDRKVEGGFRHVDQRFDQVDKRFDRVEKELHDLRSEVNARLDGLQRTLLIFGATMFAALTGAFVTQLALILTQG
jgi:hypothetical protein